VSEPTLNVLYSCHRCGIKDRHVPVRERRDGEDVVHWVKDVVGTALSRDHDAASPHCRITELSDVKIPMAQGSEQIGKAERH
jgi:hypothetical protein